MEFPVDQRHVDVDHRVPAQDAVGHRLDDALLDRGDELCGIAPPKILDSNTNPSPRGLERSRCRRRRTGRARRLLHVAAVPLGCAADRLAERDLRGMVQHVDAELRLESGSSARRGAPRPCRRSPSRAFPRSARSGTTGPPHGSRVSPSPACPRRPWRRARSRRRAAAPAGSTGSRVAGVSFARPGVAGVGVLQLRDRADIAGGHLRD